MIRTRRSWSWGLHLWIWLTLSALLASSCGQGETSSPDETAVSVNFDSQDSDGTVAEATALESAPDSSVEQAIPSRLVYVSTSGDRAIRVLRLGADGSLTRLEVLDVELDELDVKDLPLPRRPGPMVLARQRRRLYVGVSDTVATFSIANSGQLEPVVFDELTGVPVYFDLSTNEDTMISAYFGDRSIGAHVLPVGPDGADKTIEEQTRYIESGNEPHAAQFNPAGDLLYVPHRSGNKISWYSQSGSQLSLVGEIAVGGRAGPRHITFSADGEWAYVINETSVDINVYAVGPDGDLELSQTIAALPEGRSAEGNSGADIQLTPDGKFLYASVRGDDSITGFDVGPNGLLSEVKRTLTESRPRDFEITLDGKFLVVAGQNSGTLASYQIRDNGTLVLLDTQQVGDAPVWVTID